MSNKSKQNSVTPVIPDKQKEFPANFVPPNGTKAYAIARDGGDGLWSVYCFEKTPEGIRTDKVLDREMFQYAKQRVLTETIQYQINLVK